MSDITKRVNSDDIGPPVRSTAQAWHKGLLPADEDTRPAADTPQAGPGELAGWHVTNIGVELNAGAFDAGHDGLGRRMPDGIGCQFAGRQDRGIFGGRGVPGADGAAARAVGFASAAGAVVSQRGHSCSSAARAGAIVCIGFLIGRLEQPRIGVFPHGDSTKVRACMTCAGQVV